MIVYALSGPSGTGKSTVALEFAFKHQIQAIIDDGLLIVNGEKKAGTSAKFEKNALTAVRRAIFEDEAHRDEVMQAINDLKIESLLIIGTSEKMTNKIARRLQIEPIDHRYKIEDVRSDKEIQLARFVRNTQGKHVMPIPLNQVEQNFFKRLIQRGRDIFSHTKKIGETTIVRPDFHSETVEISRAAYVQIIQYELSKNSILKKYELQKLTLNVLPAMQISVYLQAPVQYDVIAAIANIQQQIEQSFIEHFGIGTEKIDIFVKGIR